MTEHSSDLSLWLIDHRATLCLVGLEDSGKQMAFELVIRGWRHQFGYADKFRFPFKTLSEFVCDERAFVAFLDRTYELLAERVVREGGSVVQTS